MSIGFPSMRKGKGGCMCCCCCCVAEAKGKYGHICSVPDRSGTPPNNVITARTPFVYSFFSSFFFSPWNWAVGGGSCVSFFCFGFVCDSFILFWANRERDKQQQWWSYPSFFFICLAGTWTIPILSFFSHPLTPLVEEERWWWWREGRGQTDTRVYVFGGNDKEKKKGFCR